jgi:hypothetical protein
MTPVATPNGIPIIKPNPTRKEGINAMSGLLARERRIMNESNPKNRRGLIRKLVRSTGAGRTKYPVAGVIAAKFTASATTSVEITDIANPGMKIARLLPIHTALGLSGVAKRDSMFPLTFSLVTGKLAKAHMKDMRIDRVKK